MPTPNPAGLDDPQIADALARHLHTARSHLAAAQETLTVGKNAASTLDAAAHAGAQKVSHVDLPTTAAPTLSGASTAGPPTPGSASGTGPANPFAARPGPAGAPPMRAPAMPGIPALPTAAAARLAGPPGSPVAARTPPRLPTLSGPAGPIANITAPAKLTASSTPEQVFAAVIAEAARRGYSLDKALAAAATMLQESGGDPHAVSPNGLWVGPFQQDTSYTGRWDPNWAINEFFNRLDDKGGRNSPDIWKTIFWLQQAPSAASAEEAFAGGRQEYMTEIQSQHTRAVSMYQQLQARSSA